MILANFKISPDSPRESSFDKPEVNQILILETSKIVINLPKN